MERQDFVLTNRHGKRMPATLRTPERAARGTMLLLHGLGGWKDQPHLVAIAEAVVGEGYSVVMFDAADGAEGPDGDFFNATNTAYINDVEDAVGYLRTQAWFTAPLIVAGHSQGGLIATYYAARHADVERLLLIAPAISWKQGAWMWLPFVLPWLVTGRKPWPGPNGKRLTLGRRWLFDFFRFDAGKDARQVSAKTLIVSAGKDETVGKPYTHAAAARRFPHATHTTLPAADHDFDGHEQELAAIVATWLSSS